MFGLAKKPDHELYWTVKGLTEQPCYTPDIAKLEQFHVLRLFVYGDEMYQRQHHDLIREYSVPLGTAFTEPKFHMWKKKLGKETFPIPLEAKANGEPIWSRHHMPEGSIKGELYAIRPYRILDLDKHRENGVQFIRVRQCLYIPYRTVIWTKQNGIITTSIDVKKIWAWMYLGVPDYWKDQLDGGYLFDPVKWYKPNTGWMPEYYYFSQKEILNQ